MNRPEQPPPPRKPGTEPAFPVADTTMTVPSEGMTLRDYFAAKAMAGLVTNPTKPARTNNGIALIAYQMADAMLAARAEPQS